MIMPISRREPAWAQRLSPSRNYYEKKAVDITDRPLPTSRLHIAQSADAANDATKYYPADPPKQAEPESDVAEQFRLARRLQRARSVAGLYLSIHSSRKDNRDNAEGEAADQCD